MEGQRCYSGGCRGPAGSRFVSVDMQGNKSHIVALGSVGLFLSESGEVDQAKVIFIKLHFTLDYQTLELLRLHKQTVGGGDGGSRFNKSDLFCLPCLEITSGPLNIYFENF